MTEPLPPPRPKIPKTVEWKTYNQMRLALVASNTLFTDLLADIALYAPDRAAERHRSRVADQIRHNRSLVP